MLSGLSEGGRDFITSALARVGWSVVDKVQAALRFLTRLYTACSSRVSTKAESQSLPDVISFRKLHVTGLHKVDGAHDLTAVLVG